MDRRTQPRGTQHYQGLRVLIWAALFTLLLFGGQVVFSTPRPVDASPAPVPTAPEQSLPKAPPVPLPRPLPQIPANQLTGTVVGPDLKPVEGASVSLGRRWSEGYWLLDPGAQAERSWFASTTTDNDGRFRFDVPEAVPFDLVVKADDLAERILPRCAGGRDYLLRMDVGTTIVGRVLARTPEGDPTSEPVTGAVVSLHTATLADVRTCTTDAEGRYQFEDVRAGVVQLEVQADGWALPTPMRRTIPAGAHFEQNLRLVPAEPLVKQAEAESTMRPVTGRVVGPEGAPIAGAYVAILAAADATRSIMIPFWRTTRTDRDGNYGLEVDDERTLAVLVRAEGHGRKTHVLPHPTEPGTLTLPDVTLRPAARLIGSVRGKDGAILPGAVVRIEGANPDRFAWALNAPPAGDPYVSTILLETDLEGRFVCAELGAGSYLIRASPDGALDLVVSRTVELTDGAVQRLDLEIDFGLTIAGGVVDAGGIAQPGVQVQLESPDDKTARRSTTSAADGRFLFRGLSAGRYLLAVTPRGATSPTRVEVAAGTEDLLVTVPTTEAR